MENHIVFDLYVAPFVLDSIGYSILDAENGIVADFNGYGDTFRVRGWGWIKYMDDAEEIYDAAESYLNGLIKGYEADKIKCVAILNDVWNNKRIN